MALSSDHWVSLVEYAAQTGVSLSTLRRQIKSNRIPFRMEEGRYMIALDQNSPSLSRLQSLEKELQRAQREIEELKTLVACYEEQMAPNGRI